ncbi:MAG: extracellular solute-binding protein [Tenericutes bacterium]|nr:extracellular solute-binding protein [Mycoplasmatota bacterium]
MIKKFLIIISFLLILVVSLSTHTVYADVSTYNNDASVISFGNYREILTSWENEGFSDNKNFSQIITPSTFSDENILEIADSFGYDHQVYEWINDDLVEISVDAPSEGLYQIALDFYSLSTDYLDMELSVLVNGELQYCEASQVILYKLWVQQEEFSLDRYGNDFFGLQTQDYSWINQSFYDPMGLFASSLLFKLDAGINTITLFKTKGDMLLGDITVSGREVLPTYKEYSEGASLYNEEVLNIVEAETPSIKNASSIQAGISRNVGITPFSVRYLKLNTLAGSTFNSERESVGYLVDVENAGYYHLTFKVLQSTVTNSNVYRTLRINGEVPFEEATSLSFYYNTKWQNATLSGDDPYLFYLDEGINKISLSVDLSMYMEPYYEINEILDYVNDLSLEIKKLTGNQVDEFRDWEITEYIPTVASDLIGAADKLEIIFDYLNSLTEKSSLSETASSLKIAIRNLRFLAEEPNEIPKNMRLLSTSTQSIASTLGNTISMLLSSPLDMDKFYIHTNVEIEEANANFFVRAWVGIKRFFISFFDERYNVKPEKDELVVWVNRSKQYTDLIQKMVDDTFTETSGINVSVSVMAAESKLILANSAGTNPDVALGVSSWMPYDLGLRGAILDLTTFSSDPEFIDVLNYYHEQSLIPLIYDEGLYGLPDTENFYVLYYRSDILESLDINIPNTWEDVTDIMPVLRRYGFNFYLPLSSSASLKSFDSTLPFLFQYGSRVYQENGFFVDLDNKESVDALQMMTELYTIYSLDTQVSSFYNDFRLGLSPIGVADFGMYSLLLNAAPDIQGLWKIALLPGVDNGTTIDRSAPGAQTANMIFANTDKGGESWEFLKWWSSTETQSTFTNMLLSTLGKECLWNSANIGAFESLSINEDDLNIILEQWSYLREIPKVPGSYQVELEISNIWNNVVIDRENLRVLLNDSIIRMDKEIHKKMSEFSYMDKYENILKPYNLATVSVIRKWKSGDFDD